MGETEESCLGCLCHSSNAVPITASIFPGLVIQVTHCDLKYKLNKVNFCSATAVYCCKLVSHQWAIRADLPIAFCNLFYNIIYAEARFLFFFCLSRNY